MEWGSAALAYNQPKGCHLETTLWSVRSYAYMRTWRSFLDYTAYIPNIELEPC